MRIKVTVAPLCNMHTHGLLSDDTGILIGGCRESGGIVESEPGSGEGPRPVLSTAFSQVAAHLALAFGSTSSDGTKARVAQFMLGTALEVETPTHLRQGAAAGNDSYVLSQDLTLVNVPSSRLTPDPRRSNRHIATPWRWEVPSAMRKAVQTGQMESVSTSSRTLQYDGNGASSRRPVLRRVLASSPSGKYQLPHRERRGTLVQTNQFAA